MVSKDEVVKLLTKCEGTLTSDLVKVLYSWANKLGVCWQVARKVVCLKSRMRRRRGVRTNKMYTFHDYFESVHRLQDVILNVSPDDFSVVITDTGVMWSFKPSAVEFVEEVQRCKSVQPADHVPDWFAKLFAPKPSKVDLTKLPRCVEELLERAKREDLGHEERVALATYLICRGVVLCLSEGKQGIDLLRCAVSKGIDAYRHQSDFNPRVTEYHLSHVAGLVGKKVLYFPYSCKKLEALGLKCNCAEVNTYVKECVRLYKQLFAKK